MNNEEREYGGFAAPEAIHFVASQQGWSVPQILVTIRDKGLSNWADICNEFGTQTTGMGTRTCRLKDVLLILRSASLLEFEPPSPYENEIKGEIRLSPLVPRLQSALNLSLAAVAKMAGGEYLMVRPMFQFSRPSEKPEVFTLMPFKPEFTELYEDVIKKVGSDLNLHVSRADELFGSKSIMADIWSSILLADVIIADCTTRNPNVFYEIGIAHTIGKRVILLAQTSEDVPFDLRHLRYIQYAMTPRGVKKLERDLSKTIQNELDEKTKS